MKTLLILRHAKSSWKDEGLSDHDRPLNARGKHDAPVMGQLVLEQQLTPNLLISSTARRARKTAEKVAESCQYQGEISMTDDLYLASPDTYLAILRDVPDEHDCVMVVGHNPGMEMLVNLLTDEDEVMPTAALAHVQLDVESWSQVRANGNAKLINLWRPKDLP